MATGANSATKYLKLVSGVFQEFFAKTTSGGSIDADAVPALNATGVLDATIINAKVTSVGAADAGKIAQFDSTGRLDSSVLPIGIGADTATIVAFEALAAGDLVNVFNVTGVANVRKADGSAAGKEAHAFVLVAVTASANAVCYFEGTNTQCTGLTPGVQYLSAVTPGRSTVTPVAGTGKVSQVVGFAVSATSMNMQAEAPITLA